MQAAGILAAGGALFIRRSITNDRSGATARWPASCGGCGQERGG